MRKFLAIALVAAALFAALTPESSAFFRRRRSPPPCPPCPCPCPPIAIAPPPVAPVKSLVIRGRTYRIIDTGERGEFLHDLVPPPAPGQAPCPDDGETYCGTARRKAKLSIAANPNVESFNMTEHLLDSLPLDAAMRALNISAAADSDRVAQENRNVDVRTWIYAFKKEDDRDYHLIIGNDPALPDAQRRYMNVEISGLPIAPGATRDTLKQVRSDFKDIMQDNFFTNQSYKRFDPPVPARVKGSLFFDVSHVPPAVGPTGLKPQTAWEIHPVTKIETIAE